jgi:hypothetical protein
MDSTTTTTTTSPNSSKTNSTASLPLPSTQPGSQHTQTQTQPRSSHTPSTLTEKGDIEAYPAGVNDIYIDGEVDLDLENEEKAVKGVTGMGSEVKKISTRGTNVTSASWRAVGPPPDGGWAAWVQGMFCFLYCFCLFGGLFVWRLDLLAWGLGFLRGVRFGRREGVT